MNDMTIDCCNRRREIINRPSYIVLFKGDDSDFQGNQSVDIVIDTELDTTGMKAHFRFMDFVQDFDYIPENKTLSLVFPNAKTSEFPLGAADATLRFEDASGKFRTVSNRIHIVVTNSVPEAYENEDSQSITVTVKGTVTWEMINGKPTFAPVATSGSYNDLTDKPTIPEPITVDPALSQTSENPVQNKVVTNALFTGFTEWVFSGEGYIDGHTYTIEIEPSEEEGYYDYILYDNGTYAEMSTLSSDSVLDITFSNDIIATRHLITPTKTSQLTNDSGFLTQHQDISGKLDDAAAYPEWVQGDDHEPPDIVSHKGRLWRCQNYTIAEPGEEPLSDWLEVSIEVLKQDALSDAQMDAVNSGATAAKVATWDGYAAQIAQKANASDVNAALAQKANAADLPYAMVTPGEWEFSGVPDGVTVSQPFWDESNNSWELSINGNVPIPSLHDEPENTMSLEWEYEGSTITATRASLPGHLCDRAGNRVVVTGDTMLTLPTAVPGYLRDFLVRLEISGSTVPTITFAAPTGETIVYETDGDEFTVPDEAGSWLYSFTEDCVAHKFAVSLKKVNVVAQGGS